MKKLIVILLISILFINEFSRFLTLEDAVNLIHKNDGLCFLAHVYQYNVENHIDFLNDVLRCVKLDGLEVYHSSFSESQIIEISSYADAHNLYKSGGSDFHGDYAKNRVLGCRTSPQESVEYIIRNI